MDATGKLPGGETFDGPRNCEQVLLEREGRFVRNLTEKMLAYALGRELQSSRRRAVEAIAADWRRRVPFSTLVLGVAEELPVPAPAEFQRGRLTSRKRERRSAS